MGKFIDKKRSQTFNVVRRSQRDPLIADETSSPLVLVPVEGARVRERSEAENARGAAYSHAEKDRLQQVVKGQEAYFDQVPGRAAGGRSANAPVRQRDRAEEEDDDDDDEAEEDEDDDAAYEDADEEDEEDNERKPAAPRAASSQRRRFADDAAEDRHVGEAAKYGIYFDDTKYDYTQHLKSMGEDPASVFVPATAKPAATGRKARPTDLFGLLDDTRSVAGSVAGSEADATAGARARFQLPADVFASPFEEDVGLLNLAAPVTGPQPELGEEVAEVLEALENDAFLGDLDEDFVLQLDEDGDDEDGDDEDDEGDQDEDWQDIDDEDEDAEDEVDEDRPPVARRGGNAAGPAAAHAGSGRGRLATAEDEDDVDSMDSDQPAGRSGRPAGSTFSLTSSVLPRSTVLQVLDDRFDRVMDQYDELEIGELDADDPEVAGAQQLDRYTAVFDKFLEQQAEDQYGVALGADPRLAPARANRPLPGGYEDTGMLVPRGKFKDVLDRPVDSDATPGQRESAGGKSKSKAAVSYQAPTGRLTVLVRGDEPRQVAWDCESVLSTYSNVYNHPAILDTDNVRRPRIRIGQSGMPLGVLGKTPSAGPPARTVGDAARATDGLDAVAVAAAEAEASEDDEDDEEDGTIVSVNAGMARQRQETPEEKRARKKAVKEQRRARREEKKSTKAAFKSEQLRQEREQQQSRQQAVASGVRL